MVIGSSIQEAGVPFPTSSFDALHRFLKLGSVCEHIGLGSASMALSLPSKAWSTETLQEGLDVINAQQALSAMGTDELELELQVPGTLINHGSPNLICNWYTIT